MPRKRLGMLKLFIRGGNFLAQGDDLGLFLKLYLDAVLQFVVLPRLLLPLCFVIRGFIASSATLRFASASIKSRSVFINSVAII